MPRILARVQDLELREILTGEKGGQFARAVAGEFDAVYAALANVGARGQPATLITDTEAQAIETWLSGHFTLAGHAPEPGERLVQRIMMTLHGMAGQLQELQRALAARGPSSTPIG